MRKQSSPAITNCRLTGGVHSACSTGDSLAGFNTPASFYQPLQYTACVFYSI